MSSLRHELRARIPDIIHQIRGTEPSKAESLIPDRFLNQKCSFLPKNSHFYGVIPRLEGESHPI